jgi:putative tricarboxylic transport membrane protein
MSGEANQRRGLREALIFSLALLAFALYLVYDATQIRQGGGFTIVGPSVFPLFAAGTLVLLAVLFLLRATVWPDAELAAHGRNEAAATHWPTVGAVVGLLVAYPFAMSTLGYLLATTLFVPAGSAILGSKRLGRDLAVGLALALLIYFGFTRLLGVRLPSGILPI